MDNYDVRFLRAILVGAAVGIPAVWAISTATFMLLGGYTFVDVAGFSALPAVFCGPFIGGLFSTSAVHDEEVVEPAVVVRSAVDHHDLAA